MKQSDVNFPIWDSLKRGGLSLWLNRRSFIPLTAFPLVVTFVTMALLRAYMPDNSSYFMHALTQIPSDFAIGMFCSLIIVIIMNAPKKKKNETVTFALNIIDQRRVMTIGAIAHTVVSYLFVGLFAVTDMIAEPLRQMAETEQNMRLDLTFLVIALLVFGVYAIRFFFVPILVIADIDIKDFYSRFRGFSLSFPVLFIKIATIMVVGVVLIPLMSLVPAEQGQPLSLIEAVFADFFASVAAIVSQAWAYAALAVGMRYMMDGDE